jgi:hypothetical protein
MSAERTELPGPAPLEWRDAGDGALTSNVESIAVRIEPVRGIDRFRRRARYRLQLGSDHAPEWWCRTLDDAKAKAEEINRSAPIYNDDEARGSAMWPCVVSDGNQERAVSPQPTPPQSIRTCWECQSQRRPVFVKPLRFTVSWWEDPGAYWRCPRCGTSRGD